MPADDLETYKAGDTEPPITFVLEERNPQTGVWGPMDFTGRTVRLLAQETRTKRRFGGPATPTATAGEVSYALQPGDLTVGDWRGEFEVSTPNGDRQSVPRDRYIEFRVLAKSG